jgi:hypothetical protein
MNIKLVLFIILISFSLANSQLLASNRYNFRNTSNVNFTDLVEFTVCGFNSSGLNNTIAAVNIWGKQPFFTGASWNNAPYYQKCADPTQSLTVFAVRYSVSFKMVRRAIESWGFKQDISCITEVLLRNFLNNNFGSDHSINRMDLGPKLVRMVFHDAMDYGNSVDKNNNTYVGSQGVDYCLYSAMSNFVETNANGVDTVVPKNATDSDADPDHSRGLDPSFWYIQGKLWQTTPFI